MVHAFEARFHLDRIAVVIAIIAILAALLLPVLSAAKSPGQGIRCLNNGKQLGTLHALHLMDAEGLFPKNNLPGSINVFCSDGHAGAVGLENLWTLQWPPNWLTPSPASGQVRGRITVSKDFLGDGAFISKSIFQTASELFPLDINPVMAKLTA